MLWIEIASERYKNLHFPVDKQKTMPAQLWAIGKATKHKSDYFIDVPSRGRMEWGKCIFQYTLSGAGILETGNDSLVLDQGSGFLIQVPGPYTYYVHPESEHWEIFYMTLYGPEVTEAWERAIKQFGHVLRLEEDSQLLVLMKHAYHMALNGNISDAFIASSVAYQFVSELNRISYQIHQAVDAWPQPVIKSIEYMEEHFSEPIDLDRIAQAAGVSKFHFARLFSKSTGYSPLKYLTKIRIDKALELITYTNLPIHQIAEMTGFQQHNYFARVFRQYVNRTPSDFREYAEELTLQNRPLQSKAPEKTYEEEYIDFIDFTANEEGSD